jgi:hypothetical protein
MIPVTMASPVTLTVNLSDNNPWSNYISKKIESYGARVLRLTNYNIDATDSKRITYQR